LRATGEEEWALDRCFVAFLHGVDLQLVVPLAVAEVLPVVAHRVEWKEVIAAHVKAQHFCSMEAPLLEHVA
jgi:hypothetical protein